MCNVLKDNVNVVTVDLIDIPVVTGVEDNGVETTVECDLDGVVTSVEYNGDISNVDCRSDDVATYVVCNRFVVTVEDLSSVKMPVVASDEYISELATVDCDLYNVVTSFVTSVEGNGGVTAVERSSDGVVTSVVTSGAISVVSVSVVREDSVVSAFDGVVADKNV